MQSRLASRMDVEWSRRDWLAGLIVLGTVAIGADAPAKKAKAQEPKVPTADLDAIRKRAEGVGLKKVEVSESAHYFAVGDALNGFRKEALQLCEEIASSFLTHFRAKGFTLEFPPDKMAVVTLKDKESYTLFKGEEVDPNEGGHFEVSEGRLVIFDFRGGDNAAQVFAPQRLNTFSLVHEAIHQLTFATGLLARAGDVPVAVSEGFATQGELWRKADRVMGRVNVPRLRVLAATTQGAGWIGVRDLLTNDDLFFDDQTSQVAYGESWLFIHEMLRTKASLAKLTSYLSLIKTRRDPGHRVEDAEEAFGKLEVLDRDLKQAALKLVRSSRL